MTSHLPNRYTCEDYASLNAALADAERVAIDLHDAIRGGDALFLDRDEIEFLARRTRQLVTAAYRTSLERR